ncbi:ferric-chelate reductase 1-like [Brevipalpus obovatus]|uniref:ferric-chelate reductase 1-like n=1 Tax=Brevipalpus obovatus TaxID=246614 RepID=UPI003D9FA496
MFHLRQLFHHYSVFLASTLIFIHFCFSSSFPSGAPSDACSNLTPRHIGTKPRSGNNSPYSIHANYYSFGHDAPSQDGIKVRIEGPPFRGFLVTAVDANSGKRIGKFAKLQGTNTIEACSGITHADRRSKRAATLLWLPPGEGSGTVSFIATVVRSFNEYYTPITAEFDHRK